MRRPLQIEVENRINRRIEIRSLDQPFAVIGRDPNCDIVLEDKQISRRHAYLQVIGGRLFWVDLDSQLGTFVEGQTWKTGWLGDNRLIAIGPNDIRQIGEARNPAAVPTGPPQGSPLVWRTCGDEQLAEVEVEFLNGPSESKTWPIRRVVSLIGTARRCKFRLADRSVEPFHCAMIRTSQGLFIVDLLGGEGVKINDVPARSARARDGDMLQIGRYQIRIHERSFDPGSNQSLPSRHDPGAVAGSQQVGFPMPLFPAVGPASNPRVEILPYQAGANYPTLPERNELTESVLVPLVSQFGMMQQQMFDQFQQTMNMMAQMFGKMHESQMELIRQEFDRLNDLTSEINDLKAELAEMTRKQAEAASKPSAPSTESILAEMKRRQANAAALSASAAARPPSAVPTAKISSADTSPPTTTSTATVAAPASAVMGPQATVPIAETPPPLDPVPMPAEEKSAQGLGGDVAPNPPPRPKPSPGSGPQGEREVIFWLHNRITDIQKERESRWQKILKLIPGAS